MASSATDSSNKDRDIREKLVRTGDVDVMVSVGNNFFYTLSLPCSLWFFDRNKHADIRDKVLFIDARNYYTVVDRTLNEWTEWQLRNLQAIVHLYRGERENYQQLLADYDKAVDQAVGSLEEQGKPFSDLIDEGTRGHFWGLMGWINAAGHDYQELSKRISDQINQTKGCIKAAEGLIEKRKLKAMRLEGESFCSVLSDLLNIVNEHEWLTSKFGEGQYQDVLGLCKVATIQEIEEKNYSLTPGAYVGVAEVEDDGVDFHERMNEIHAELSRLNQEANVLMDEIQKAWEELK
jgi:type I restriction enzyme M protein